eukprot:COSAG01_NODE_1525_length_10018_cov_4.556709_4_plen_50_part_00
MVQLLYWAVGLSSVCWCVCHKSHVRRQPAGTTQLYEYGTANLQQIDHWR